MFNAIFGGVALIGLVGLVVHVWRRRQPVLCGRCGLTAHHAAWVKCAPPPINYADLIADALIAEGSQDPTAGVSKRVP